MAGLPLRREASTGERKALALALLAALAGLLARAGREPLLLLDDADAELDRRRAERLLERFSPFRQVVFSSSRPEVWPASGGPARVRLEGGRLAPGAAS
jgi:recombinational DNA repair ATPase RecF